MSATEIQTITRLKNVDRIERPGIGHVYRAVLPIADVYTMLHESRIRYAPRYQRGYRKGLVDVEEERFDELLPLSHPDLEISEDRANEMAVKLLQGNLFSAHLSWNARKRSADDIPDYDPIKRTLTIDSVLAVPDTAHRHRAYYRVIQWHKNRASVPEEVMVGDRPVSEDDIRELLETFDPDKVQVFVDIYNLTPEDEGRLFDEFNSDAKSPSTAVGIDLNPEKTPSRKFVYALMKVSEIFARPEIETRSNTIGSKSRKVTTVATLEASVRPMKRTLAELEKDQEAYDDLVEFAAAFFGEYATHYPELQPNGTAEARNQLRDRSFALSNIIMFPLFRIIFDLWERFEDDGLDWRKENGWKEVVTKLTGTITSDVDAEYFEKKGRDVKKVEISKGDRVNVMSRHNPAWRGKILIEGEDKEGRTVWSLSSTRQTRQAAYNYLRQIAGLTEGDKGAQAA